MASNRPIREYVFPFGPGTGAGEADALPTALLGTTGAAMADLSRDRFPVPPGFTLSAEVCACYARHGAQYPAGVWDQIRAQIRRLEGLAMSEADEGRRPLVLTVRADASAAMPDAARRPITLGFSDRAVTAFARATGAPSAAGRGYAALIRDFGILVEGIAPGAFDEVLGAWRERHPAADEAGPDVHAWRELCDASKRVYLERTRRPFPQEMTEQMRGVLGALFDAWSIARQVPAPIARTTGMVGVAITVSIAVFGDLDGGSARGVACSRDPADGSAAPSGRLEVPGGADRPLAAMAAVRDTQVRAAHSALRQALVRAERRAGQPQEVEFVVEKGRLWIVHARAPRRSAAAALRWAAEMAGGRDLETGRSLPRALTPDAALLMLTPSDLDPVPVGTSRGVRDPARRAFDQVMAWAGTRATAEILCHAAGVEDARAARDLGAAGIGLLDPAPLLAGTEAASAVRSLSGDAGDVGVRTALGDLFEQILSILSGHPVSLAVPRPGDGEFAAAVAAAAGTGAASAEAARISVVRAFLEAAFRLGRRRVRPHVSLAIEADSAESFEEDAESARGILDALQRSSRTRLRCPIGAMLSVPRAVLTADAVAEHAEFLVLPVRPLDAWLRGRAPRSSAEAAAEAGESSHRFDVDGLGALIEAGLKRARTARPGLPCAVSVEDIPDAHLLRLCQRAGVHQIICPPARVPAARLAAAQAAIRSGARQF